MPGKSRYFAASESKAITSAVFATRRVWLVPSSLEKWRKSYELLERLSQNEVVFKVNLNMHLESVLFTARYNPSAALQATTTELHLTGKLGSIRPKLAEEFPAVTTVHLYSDYAGMWRLENVPNVIKILLHLDEINVDDSAFTKALKSFPESGKPPTYWCKKSVAEQLGLKINTLVIAKDDLYLLDTK